eukprot:8123499-Alexandrium_andersonii.AAC.1
MPQRGRARGDVRSRPAGRGFGASGGRPAPGGFAAGARRIHEASIAAMPAERMEHPPAFEQ